MKMKLNTVVYIVICFFVLGACNPEEINIYCPVHIAEQENVYENYELVWSEEFDVDGLPNPDVWGYERGQMRANGWQDYKVADLNHSRIENGHLIIEATYDPHVGKDTWTGTDYEYTYSSASLTTQGKMTFQYGRLDIAAKMPRGVSLWPALWLRPDKNIYDKVYAEIDMMESVWGWNDEGRRAYFTIYASDSKNGAVQKAQETIVSNSLDTKYHLYSMIWDEKQIQLLFDNEVIARYQKEEGCEVYDWPFDQPFFLIMNLAIGGTWGGDYGKDPSIFPKKMEIEYVRYYKKIKADEDEDIDDGEETDNNLMKNGGFEQVTSTPVRGGRFSGSAVYDCLEQWHGVKNTNYAIDGTGGADRTSKSLKFNLPDTKVSWWDMDLYYEMSGVSAGKYVFSFYAKSNIDSSPFVLSIAYDENEEDVARQYKEHKTIVFTDNGQEVKGGVSGQKDVYATYVDNIGKDWKKYSVTFEIPKNELLRFAIKPYVSATPGNDDYKMGTAATNLLIWFDEFSLEKGK